MLAPHADWSDTVHVCKPDLARRTRGTAERHAQRRALLWDCDPSFSRPSLDNARALSASHMGAECNANDGSHRQTYLAKTGVRTSGVVRVGPEPPTDACRRVC